MNDYGLNKREMYYTTSSAHHRSGQQVFRQPTVFSPAMAAEVTVCSRCKRTQVSRLNHAHSTVFQHGLCAAYTNCATAGLYRFMAICITCSGQMHYPLWPSEPRASIFCPHWQDCVPLSDRFVPLDKRPSCIYL